MRQTGDKPVAVMDEQQYLCLNNMHVLVPKKVNYSPYYLTAIINSKLMNWYYLTLNPESGEALAEVKKTNVAKFPIKKINLSVSQEIYLYNKLTELAQNITTLNKELNKQISGRKVILIKRQITALTREIDQLVYKLYGLTPKEIAIVEGSNRGA